MGWIVIILICIALAIEWVFEPRFDFTEHNELLLWYWFGERREHIKIS
jgi:hypothetical protein